MKIQVLGSGCANCKNLHEAVEAVVKELDLDIKVDYSTDIAEIIALGAMSSPVFAINGSLVTSGKIPSKEEIKKAILDQQSGIPTKNNPSSEGGCSCGGSC